MWMSKIIIKSFGGLKDVTLDLKPGYTNIVWDNEAGKSTIMAFIKLMFYGKLPGGNDIGKNLRKKYQPWDESKMQGAIEFEVDGTKYRIEKTFGKTPAGDKVHLMNLSSGEEMKVSKDLELGQQFFDMDLGAFEKTIFIQNTGTISGSGDKDSIAEKISNLSDGMEEEVSIEQVLKHLLMAKEDLVSKSGKTGNLVRKKEQLERLEQEYKHLLAEEEEQSKITGLLDEVKQKIKKKADEIQKNKEHSKWNQLSELLHHSEEEEEAKSACEEYRNQHPVVSKEQKEQGQMLKEWIAKEEAVLESQEKNLKELLEQQEQNKEKREEVLGSFDSEGKQKQQDEIEQKKQRLLELKQEQRMDLEEEKNLDYEFMMQGEASGLKETLEEMKEKKRIKEEADSKKKSFAVVFWVIFAIGLILLFKAFPVGLFVLIIAIGMRFSELQKWKKADSEYKEMKLLISVQQEMGAKQSEVKKQKYEQKKEELRQRMQERLEEEERINKEIEEAYERRSKCDVTKEQFLGIDSQVQALSDKIKAFENEKSQAIENIDKKKEELNALLTKCQVSEVCELEERMKEQQRLEEDLSNKKMKTDTLYAAYGLERMSLLELKEQIQKVQDGYSKEEREALASGGKENLEELQKEYEVLLKEQNELYKKCKQIEKNPKDLEEMIQELRSECEDMEHYYDVVSIAFGVMNDTTQQIRQSFGPKLNEKTAKYFCALTNDAYEDVLVQSDYGIMALKKGDISYRSYKYLSQGTIDQAYLALRLALIEIISEETNGNRLPLLLDDIFMQYDETRRTSGVEFLKEYAKTGQVILFTPRAMN